MSEEKKISFTLNGEKQTFLIQPNEKLSTLLRRSSYKGLKIGCEEGSCGACTVLWDGQAVCSCILYAFQAEGRRVETIEALGDFDNPHPIQTALVEEGAVQCGYCTPGFILAAKALLDEDPDPSEEKMMEYLDGNLCRCTGYEKIWTALRRVVSSSKAEVSNG